MKIKKNLLILLTISIISGIASMMVYLIRQNVTIIERLKRVEGNCTCKHAFGKGDDGFTFVPIKNLASYLEVKQKLVDDEKFKENLVRHSFKILFNLMI